MLFSVIYVILFRLEILCLQNSTCIKKIFKKNAPHTHTPQHSCDLIYKFQYMFTWSSLSSSSPKTCTIIQTDIRPVITKWLCNIFQIRLKKINAMSQIKLPRAFVFRCAFDSAKLKVWIFFPCLIFFQFLWTCLSKLNIHEKIWQTQKNTLNNRLLQHCVLSCILFIQKSSSIFQSCDLTRLLLRKKKEKKTVKKKPHLGQVFQSVTSLRHSIYFF